MEHLKEGMKIDQWKTHMSPDAKKARFVTEKSVKEKKR